GPPRQLRKPTFFYRRPTLCGDARRRYRLVGTLLFFAGSEAAARRLINPDPSGGAAVVYLAGRFLSFPTNHGHPESRADYRNRPSGTGSGGASPGAWFGISGGRAHYG